MCSVAEMFVRLLVCWRNSLFRKIICNLITSSLPYKLFKTFGDRRERRVDFIRVVVSRSTRIHYSSSRGGRYSNHAKTRRAVVVGSGRGSRGGLSAVHA